MLERLRGRVNGLTENRSLRDDDEVYLYVALEMVIAFAALMHVGLIFVYILGGSVEMTAINIIFIGSYAFGLLLVRQGRYYYFSGTVVTGLVLLYGTLSNFFTGFHTFDIMYVVMGIACLLVIPFAPKLHRWLYGVVFLAGAVYTTYVSFNPPPPMFPVRAGVEIALAIYNVVMGIMGIAFLLTVVTTARKVLAMNTETKLGDMITQANSDTLTGLYNRRYAHVYFDNLMQTSAGEVWCVAMLDVDNFKSLNDTYGHPAGDKVLSALADIMRQQLRSSDSIFRWGGEEFLIVLKGTSLQNATQVLERMLATIAKTPIDAEGNTLRITATVGITVLDLANIQRSIDQCDARLYIGKRSGKNKVVSKG